MLNVIFSLAYDVCYCTAIRQDLKTLLKHCEDKGLQVDIKYLEELLLKISGFIMENPEIEEMDINPLIAYKTGAIAVDARIILREREEIR